MGEVGRVRLRRVNMGTLTIDHPALDLVDPAGWICKVTGAEPWSRQEEILKELFRSRRLVVRSANAVGKSWTAAQAILLFATHFHPSVVVTTAPTFRQVRDVIWRELHRSWRSALERGWKLGKEPLQTIWRPFPDVLVEGIAVPHWAASNIQGPHSEHVLVVVDEAQGLTWEVWSGIQTLLRGRFSFLLMIGNPTRVEGPFYEAFRDPQFSQMGISALESPNVETGRILIPGLVTKEDVEEIRQRYGEDSWEWKVWVLGEFAERSEDVLVALSWVEKAGSRNEPGEGRVEVGADIARYGGDHTVFVARKGGCAFALQECPPGSTMETAGRLIAFARKVKAELIKVDVTGVGAGVVDRLKEQGYPVVGVEFGGRPIERDRFENKSAEMWWNLAEMLQKGEAWGPVFKDRNVVRDLTGRKYSYTSAGRIKLESKEAMRKRGVPSPDWGDAVALAYAAVERPKGKVPLPVGVERRSTWRK